MIRSTTAVKALAIAGAVTVALVGCSSTSTPSASTSASSTSTKKADPAASCKVGTPSTDALKIGTLLPLTGSLAYLGPPAVAGAGLALDDINKAGGVLGKDVDMSTNTDSGDSTDMTVSTASAAKLKSAGVSAVLGAESSSVTLNVIDQITGSCTIEISPANTASSLSGYSSYYFRTAPPDSVQGSALGQKIVSDGNAKVAFLVFNDPYGTGLRDSTQQAIESAGGSVVYGGTGKSEEFPPGQTSFSSEVTAAIASKPDAIVILAFDETKSIVPELVAQGWDMSKTYMSDGNTAAYPDFKAGTLEGGQGTIPGAQANSELKSRLSAWYKANDGKALSDYSYAAESYDAITLIALAAEKGKGTDAPTIQANMAAVSGANGGTKCTTYADCKTLLDAGKDIQYTGPSGIGPFNSNNDPSSAYIGIYKYNAKNEPVYQSSVQGDVK